MLLVEIWNGFYDRARDHDLHVPSRVQRLDHGLGLLYVPFPVRPRGPVASHYDGPYLCPCPGYVHAEQTGWVLCGQMLASSDFYPVSLYDPVVNESGPGGYLVG